MTHLDPPQLVPRHFGMISRQQEENILREFDPFTAARPCKCGCRERVLNRRKRVFCQRCGRPEEGVTRMKVTREDIEATTPDREAFRASIARLADLFPS